MKDNTIGKEMLDTIKEEVYKLLDKENSGHGNDHINRVLRIALKFAEKENANLDIVSMIALLHDVDDRKLFGIENAENFTNARIIMEKAKVPSDIQEIVIDSLKNIGYSTLLKGHRPNSIEGKVVSDADMCDAMGVNGVLRTYQFSTKYNDPFFDKDIWPRENLTYEEYSKKASATGVCHFFEKLLKLKDLMLTSAGKMEAKERHDIIVNILYHLFEEENALEWKEYLDEFLRK